MRLIMTKQLPTDWIENIVNYSEIFSDLELILGKKQLTQWPDCELLMSYLENDLHSFSGKPITMSAQDNSLPYPEMSYEERIYHTGIISTREKNWHDFFNAMIWVLFPQTKKLLNYLHIQEIQNQANTQRTIGRDAITHLDESGLIIVSSKQSLIDGLRSHRWIEVFYQQRELWSKEIAAFIFGHGIYEKALLPFIGFTGKMYAIKVETDFFSQEKLQQYKQLDQILSEDIKQKNSLKNNQMLSPLPVLGIPKWSELNKQKNFYLNQNYFRPAKN